MPGTSAWPTRSGPAWPTTRGSIRSSPRSSAIYLGEEPILANVETFRPLVPAHRQHILANLEKLVVKAVDASGGYGMLIGPASTAAAARGVRAEDRGQPAGLHRPADDQPEPAPDLRRRPARRPPRRPPAVHPLRRRHHRHARRPDPRRAAGGEPGGQQLARGRHQGHLGPPRRRSPSPTDLTETHG